MSPLEVTIVYDGECPFCQRYVKLQRLRENVDVTLVDARQQSEVKTQLLRQGYDLDEGMAVISNQQVYHGADAIYMISLLSDGSGFINRICSYLFRYRWLARLSYPILRLGRNLALRLLGREKIGGLGGL